MALMRFDPFREIDRFAPFREIDRIAEQVMAGSRVSRTMPMEAFRRGDEFFVYIDLPGINEDDVELTVERNVVASGRSGFLRARKATSSSSTNYYAASLPGSSSSVTTSTPASSALSTPAACSS